MLEKMLSPVGEEVVNLLRGGGRHGELGEFIFQDSRVDIVEHRAEVHTMCWRMKCTLMLTASSTALFAC